MRAPPQWQIDAWPAPNFVDPVTRGDAKIILNLILYPIVLLLILLRVYTRVFHLKVNTFSIDDIMILLAMIPTTVFFVLSLLADLHFLWRRHVYDIPLTNVETGLKLVLVTEFMFALACTFTKLSMLFLIRRVLATATLFWRRITLAAIWIVAIQGTVFEFAIIFQCRPPQDYWKVVFVAQPQCINQTVVLLVAGVINTLTDFMVVILPIRTVLSLELPKRQTYIIIVLFALGFLSSIAGVVRTYYTYEVTVQYDNTWNSFPVWISAAVELYVGLVCASVPATKPFFSTYIPRMFAATSHYTHRSRPHTSHHRLSDPHAPPAKNSHLSAISTVSGSVSPSPRRSRLLTLSPLTFHKPNIHSNLTKSQISPCSPCSPSSSTTTKVGSRTVSAVGSRRITSMKTVTESVSEGDDHIDRREDGEMQVSLSSIALEENEAMRKEMEDEFLFQYGNVYTPGTQPRHIHHHSRRHSQSRRSGEDLNGAGDASPYRRSQTGDIGNASHVFDREVEIPDDDGEEDDGMELDDFVFLGRENLPRSSDEERPGEGDMVIQDFGRTSGTDDLRRSWGSWEDDRGRERERSGGNYQVYGYGFGAGYGQGERLQVRGQENWERKGRPESSGVGSSFKDFDLELGFP